MPPTSRSLEFRHKLQSLTRTVRGYVILGAASISLVLGTSIHTFAKEGESTPGATPPPVPVTATTAQQQAMPVWIDVQGTVIPLNYVNVMPRVAGLLQSVNFREGQAVKAGQVLATIDPQPFRIQVELAQAQLMRDQAQLAGAQADLERYETLLAQDSIAVQQVVDQRATVAQLKGTVAADKAAVDNAQLQLDWTRITSPGSGIAGLRQVDVGNMVGTTGAIGGGASVLTGTASASTPIVTIAQVQPITATFAIAQNQLPAVLSRMRSATLPVQAWDQRRTALLDTGKVIAVDNLINAATGTVMVKAQFANARMTLFPNQFVNVRLLVDTLEQAIVVPSAAIATGASGSYVYVIDSGDKVSVRPVSTGATNQDYTAISAGLQPGERVVTDGLDRLRSGSKVQVVAQYSGAAAGTGGSGKPLKNEKAGAEQHRGSGS
ncbi:multidrug resistance protein MdtA precursor [mine drainage metagenome]|uniref:Multidrug resistance protein MdtA n=1 Tax=mine drainage metagenome TaxID=410659 RepID=A0A1J5TIH1_9ZZZZ